MAKKIKEQNSEEEMLGGVQKLKSLKIKKFRAIKEEVTIELDEIVVLVGPNNIGKSSILKAYEIIMKHGSKECSLSIQDFHQEKIENQIEISLETFIDPNSDKAPAKKWIIQDNGESYVREKWIWTKPGDPKRSGFNNETNDWDERVPWGAPGVANSNRPYPHRVDAFSNPEDQINEIKEIVGSIIKDKIALIKDPNNNEKTALEVITDKLSDFKKIVTEQTDTEITDIEDGISKIISEVFPKYQLKIEKIAGPDTDLLKGKSSIINFDSELKLGKSDANYMGTLANHGSGARRTLLWSALKYIREHNKGKVKVPNERSHVLLLDEPEICLHPSAIRYAADVLYELPQTAKWQVMLTTHCPLFIDLSKDNTTIIRVDLDGVGNVQGTSLFRPLSAQLSADEKELIKLMNIYDPYFAEFFFSKNILVVEGDTEYAAFKYLASINKDFEDLHIIRARSKAGIVAVCKILNQFQSRYSILHDSDYPKLENENVNPAWTVNENIRIETANGTKKGAKINLYASKKNFENAFLAEEVKKDKPFNAISQLKKNEGLQKSLKEALEIILKGESENGQICKWLDLASLEKFISA